MTRPSIITKRLILHPANNDEDLSTYLSMLSPDEFVYQFGYEYNEGLLDGYSFTGNGVVCYAVFPHGERTMIGYVGIMPYESDPAVGELEYYIAKERRGNGCCQEASRALIRAFRSGALTGVEGKVVTAEVTAGNDVSMYFSEKTVGNLLLIAPYIFDCRWLAVIDMGMAIGELCKELEARRADAFSIGCHRFAARHKPLDWLPEH